MLIQLVSNLKAKLLFYYHWHLKDPFSLSNIEKNSELILSSIQTKGSNIKIAPPTNIQRPQGLSLGSNVQISKKVDIDATAGVIIGDNSTIGENVKISTQLENGDPLNYRNYKSVYIGSNVCVGPNSIISPGSFIGRNSDISHSSLIKEKRTGTKLSEDFAPIYDNEMFFVLSTGRSGTKTIANLLTSHSKVKCYHDPYSQFNGLACAYLYGDTPEKEIHKQLGLLINDALKSEIKIIGISDQKTAAFILILKDLLPKAKFIWLKRNPKSFINSSYPRGWYQNREFGLPENINEFYKPKATPSDLHAAHRISGYKVGEFTEIQWNEMTAFERICWYYNYWHSLIEKQLEQIPKYDYLELDLESLDSELNKLQEFLSIDVEPLILRKTNKANYKKITLDDWTIEMNALYSKYFNVNN